MAMTVDQIKKLIYEQIALKPSLALIAANPSQVAIWKDFVNSIAVVLGVKDQLQDEFKANIEDMIALAPLSNTDWVRGKAFEFQYDSVTPQALQITTIIPPQVPQIVVQYNPIDVSKRLLTVCCVRFSASRILEMFVAKSFPPVKLATSELNSLQGYFTDGGSSSTLALGLGIAGIAYNINSLDPDLVFFEGTIDVDGQYSATIKASVISAIEIYLANLGPKGVLDTLQFINAVQSVTGVIDLNIVNLAIRSAVESFSSPDQKHYLIQGSVIVAKSYESASGYAIGETTTSNNLNDKITIAIV